MACSTPVSVGDGPGLVPRKISVLDIIDGDTIRIASLAPGETIDARLDGYDTPEVTDPGCAEELALGQTASRRLQIILHDARRIDSQQQGIDQYRRVLLRLTVDGRDLADIMVSEGLAARYSGGPRIDWCARLGAT